MAEQRTIQSTVVFFAKESSVDTEPLKLLITARTFVLVKQRKLVLFTLNIVGKWNSFLDEEKLMFNKQRVESWIPKGLSHLIESVDEDSEVVEVLLKDGLHNSCELETVWVFAKERYAYREYTLNAIKQDLQSWLDLVEPIN